VLVLGTASPAFATLIGQTLQVELISPNDGGLHLTDIVVAAGGGDILPADGSAIGALLLSTEFIDLGSAGGDQIAFGFEAGTPGGTTGYGDLARYVISGLYVGQGLVISDVAISTNNIAGVLPGVTVQFAANQLTVFIDDFTIGSLPGIDRGSITLDLTTTIIPEPGTATLLGLGLASLTLSPRRRGGSREGRSTRAGRASERRTDVLAATERREGSRGR
jgi:hypothetical protein